MSSPSDNLYHPIERLNNPPIVEASIDIVPEKTSAIDTENLKEMLKQNLPSYSHEIIETEEYLLQISKKGEPAKRTALGFNGLKLVSEDKTREVMINAERCIFSRTKDYVDWENLCSDAEQAWAIYADIYKPTEINSLIVGFVNEFSVASTPFSLNDYLFNAPEEKQIDDWDLRFFHHHDAFTIDKSPFNVHMIKRIEPGKSKGSVAILLDIRVYHSDKLKSSWGEIRKCLDKIRDIKNKAFFRSVPKKKIEEYK